MAIEWERIGRAGAALSGQLPQYMQAESLQAERAGRADEERRQKLLQMNRGIIVDLQAGRVDSARTQLEAAKGIVPDSAEVDRVLAMTDQGDIQGALAELSHLDNRAVAMGQLEPMGGGPKIHSVKGGQAIVQDGDQIRAQGIEGYDPALTGGGDSGFQFGDSNTLKDEDDNLFLVTQKRNPATGNVEAAIAPVGHTNPVSGRLQMVNSMGLTPGQIPGQKGDETTVVENRKRAAEIAKSSFEQLAGTRKSIANIEQAISALDRGANTGPIFDLLPTVSEASVMLQNVQNQMGLDIVGATTFGSLSESELRFATDTAMPTNLEPPALRQWLVDKKKAQTKMATELAKAATFFSKGGTIDEYLEKMEEEGKLKYESPQASSDTDLPPPGGRTPPAQTGGIKILGIREN